MLLRLGAALASGGVITRERPVSSGGVITRERPLASGGPLPSAAAIAQAAAADAAAAPVAGRRAKRRARRQPQGERRGECLEGGALPLDAEGAQKLQHLDAISLWLDDALEEV